MAHVAEEANISRESLYRALSKEGNPRFSTLDSVLNALDMTLTVQPKQPVTSRSAPPVPSSQRGQQTIATVFEVGGNATITSTVSTAFHNVATVGDTVHIAVSTPTEQSEGIHAGFLPGFIAYATGAIDQNTINNAIGD